MSPSPPEQPKSVLAGTGALDSPDSEPGPTVPSAISRQRKTVRWRLPIALKFALPIMLLAIALMAWQASTAIRASGDILEEEINDKGIELVTSLSVLMRPDWFRDLEGQDDLVRTLLRFESSPRMDDVCHVVVFDTRGTPIALSRRTLSVTRRSAVDYAPAREAGVVITELRADGVPVRCFSRGVTADNPAGEELGRVELFLSAQHIVDSRRNISRQLVRNSIIACLFAAGASFCLASFLTRPIRTLVRDMREVSRGNLEHESTIDTVDELGDLARAFNVMTSNLQSAQDARLARKAMEHELSVATRIQAGLLPERPPSIDGIDLAVFYQSAKEVGGDYYDFIRIDEHRWGFVVADVSGKGVPGSLVMTMVRSLSRMAAAGEPNPDRTLSEVNRCLSSDMSPGMFVTLLYFVLDTRTREIRLVRAGHNAPLFFHCEKKRLVHVQPSGIALGLDRDGRLFDSELEVQRFELGSGDLLVVYTDGIPEGKNALGEDFGEKRFYRIIARHHGETSQRVTDAIIAELADHQKGVRRSDDITLLVARGT